MNTKLTTEAVVPEQTYHYEQVTVAISACQIGDLRGGRKVANIKTGPKNTELFDENGKRIDYFPNATGILIERRVADQEVSDARYRAGRHNRILGMLENRREPVLKAQAALAEQVAELGFVDHWKLDAFIAAQGECRVWEGFAGVVENLANREGEKAFEGDLVDAMTQYAEYLQEQVMSSYKHRALSRSTGVVSNLLDDVDMEATVKFIEQTSRWF